MNTAALEKKLTALKISGAVSGIKENDFFISYIVNFNDDVTLAKIKARAADLALFFEVPQIEIETDAGAVVLKIPKKSREIVYISSFTDDIAGGYKDYEIPLIIGNAADGTRLYYDLTRAPHILAAGATGSGKSVFMHNCILSTFYTGNCKIALIDVKKVEFSMYNGIPHLLSPVCTDARAAADLLVNLCGVMDNRYKTLEENHARNIKDYRKNGGAMPYIVVFIDELADLLLINSRIEFYLVRLAQLGRAAGIHLVTATQRPDAQILSGIIRANIPTRVCFAVQKATDSRIVLDMAGGEKLRGAGDGLFLPVGSREPVRFQAPYMSTDTLQRAVERAKQL